MEIAHPVRVAIEDYQSRSNPTERLDTLLLAFELLLRVDALLLAAVFLDTEECRDDKVRSLLLSRKFQLGEWYSLLQTLVSVVPGRLGSDLRTWFIRLDPALQGVLRLRNPRTHAENRTRPEFVAETLRHGEPLVERCLAGHPDLGRFQEGDRGRLWLEQAGTTINCGPFLLAGSLVGHSGTVLIYRGSSANKLGYASLFGLEYWSSDTYREVVDLLRKKISPLEFVEGTIAPDILHGRMLDSSRQTLDRLIELKRYRPEITLDRVEADTVLQAFLNGSRPLLLVDGPAGAGKTTWLGRVAEKRMAAAETVLLETADRLPEVSFPDALGPLLRVRGEIATAFERLATSSADGRVLIALDDLAVLGREREALLSLFRWVEKLSATSPVRIVATIRSDRLRAFLSQHEDALPASLLWRFEMPPLSSHELVTLAEKLPVPPEANRETIVATRRKVALRIGEIASSSARRPGLAVLILESVSLGLVPSGFSAALVYGEMFRREILDATGGGVPKKPWRARLVRRLAEVLLKRLSLKGAIDDDDLLEAGLIDTTSGERSADYETLLSNGVLVEMVENYVSYVSFADPRFFEFIAALNLSVDELTKTLPELCRQSQRFPAALGVSAFLLIRVVASSGAASTFSAIEPLADWRERLLLDVALLDGPSFLAMFEPLVCSVPSEAQSLVNLLLRVGEPRLAVQAVQRLIDCATDHPDRLAEARFLHARALYEVDDCDGAERELAWLKNKRTPRVLALEAEVAVTRGEFAHARSVYEAVLETPCSPQERGHALRGLGYVLGRMGDGEEAERRLREAIESLAAQGDSPILAEAWGDLGELLGKSGRHAEARQCLEENMAVNTRLGHLGGIGVAEGLMAELDFAEGQWDQAESRLRKTLDIARRLDYRWREAWVLERLGTLHRARGRPQEGALLLEEARRLFQAIGSKKQ